jgi:PDZ domain-containing protein
MNRRYPLPLLALTLPLLALGCASGYTEFYRPTQGLTPETITALRPSPAPANPIVERSQPGDIQKILDAYAKRGYVMIGNSMFNSGRRESEDAAVHQGQKVGADVVLILNPRYTGSVSSTVPLTTPTTTTSYSSGSATGYGPGGPVTAYGSGTTTTYGSTTTYMPMTIHRLDYGAVYFVKQRLSLGLFTRDLSDSERQELQSNKGAAVRVVVDGSPAFEADILVGDVITTVDGVSVSGAKTFNDLLRERRGRFVSLSIVRRGQLIVKSVQLNP